MVSEKEKLADIICYKSWKKNFKGKVINFVKKRAKIIYDKLEESNFRSDGCKQVVNEIMRDLRKYHA